MSYFLQISQELCDRVKDKIKLRYSHKKVFCACRNRSWQSSRYIQVSTPIKDIDLHYEYYLGHVEMHIEGKFVNSEYIDFLRFLRNGIKNEADFKWHEWETMRQGLCRYEHSIDTWEKVIEGFEKIIAMIDPIIEKYMVEHPDMFNQNVSKSFIDLSYNIDLKKEEENLLEPDIKNIALIDFACLTIPPYQRPYKWTGKNVTNLINDIITFKKKSSYRLGTLVLHHDEIVDGQQRIITISLLLHYLFKKFEDDKLLVKYNKLRENLQKFCDSSFFSNKYSLANIVDNINIIKERDSDLDAEFFEFLMERCEFVVIRLGNISEAFQFFDSQNARGKDLEAHDLLKAFHLREMIEPYEKHDSMNIDSWQGRQTDDLAQLFLTMFRVKQWIRGKTARYFTKDDIDTFKGISINSKERYPYYRQEVICHIFSDIYFNDPVRKIDFCKLEYPFQLDRQCINGSRFFDMVRYYLDLYDKIRDSRTFDSDSKAKDILLLLGRYQGSKRTGDLYVREMFDTLLLYYVDRFGFQEIGKVMQKFFIWAYTLRLTSYAVQLASIDNMAKDSDYSMFNVVRDASTPYDIINMNLHSLVETECQSSKCEEIKKKFKDLHKLYNNGK